MAWPDGWEGMLLDRHLSLRNLETPWCFPAGSSAMVVYIKECDERLGEGMRREIGCSCRRRIGRGHVRLSRGGDWDRGLWGGGTTKSPAASRTLSAGAAAQQ